MPAKMLARFNKPIIRTAFNYVWNKNLNFLIGITGRVGTGKSLTAAKIGHDFDPKFKLEDSLVYSIHDLIRKSLGNIKIAGKPIDLKDFKEIKDIYQHLMDNKDKIYIKRGKVIIMDETSATSAYVRDFLSQDNKTIAKLIQIWRILGLVVIFIVPEDIKLADSTIQKFLDIEIRMLNTYKKEGYATCIAWEYRGWNKRTKEPIRWRMRGCRYGGVIYVKLLPPELVKLYETISRVFKIQAIVNMGLQYEVDKKIKIAATKSIWDDIRYVKDNLEEFKNERGKITTATIINKLGVSTMKANQIRTHIATESINKI